jgi:hypothetical protein
MASFGWSFGDVIAGIKVVWTIYEAVSDGPLSMNITFISYTIQNDLNFAQTVYWSQKALRFTPRMGFSLGIFVRG